MHFGGIVLFARAGLAALLRFAARLPLWLAELHAVAADVIDPDMPESVRRPREWLPRLWARTGGRTPFEGQG